MHMLTTGYAINWKQIYSFAHTQLLLLVTLKFHSSPEMVCQYNRTASNCEFRANICVGRRRGSAVGTLTRLQARRRRNRGSVPDSRNRFSSPPKSPPQGPTQPPIQWASSSASPRARRLGCEADNTPAYTAKVRSRCSYNPPPLAICLLAAQEQTCLHFT